MPPQSNSIQQKDLFYFPSDRGRNGFSHLKLRSSDRLEKEDGGRGSEFFLWRQGLVFENMGCHCLKQCVTNNTAKALGTENRVGVLWVWASITGPSSSEKLSFIAPVPFANRSLLPGTLDEQKRPHSPKAWFYFTHIQSWPRGWRWMLGATISAQRHYWQAEKKKSWGIKWKS